MFITINYHSFYKTKKSVKPRSFSFLIGINYKMIKFCYININTWLIIFPIIIIQIR